MLMYIVYFFVFMLSCMFGAVVGLGGGVIIRPILDAIAYHNVLNIAFLSSAAVLVMAVVSTLKKVKDGTKIDTGSAALISFGALIGGALGNLILEHLVSIFYAESDVQLLQTASTIVVLILAIYFTTTERFRFNFKAKIFYPVLGLLLGITAIFLGISGGPVNVPVFMVLFSMPAKQATAYSIVVIFFSHLFRMITMGFTVGFAYFDLQFLLFTIPAAIIGGIVGSIFSRMVSDNSVKRAFNFAMAALILLNAYNALMFILSTGYNL